jgi:hypothetical protein
MKPLSENGNENHRQTAFHFHASWKQKMITGAYFSCAHDTFRRNTHTPSQQSTQDSWNFDAHLSTICLLHRTMMIYTTFRHGHNYDTFIFPINIC